MRKSIFVVVLSLVAVLAVACGGNNAAKGNGAKSNGAGGGACGGGGGEAAADPQAQWDALYKPGANWTYKMTGDMLQKTEVGEVTDGVAKTKVSMKMGDGEWMAPTDGEAKRPEPVKATDPDPKWKELGKGKENVKVGGTEFETAWIEGEYDGKKSKNWTSTQYGIVVKSEYEGAVTMELVELNAK
jgi:hypothetical protein